MAWLRILILSLFVGLVLLLFGKFIPGVSFVAICGAVLIFVLTSLEKRGFGLLHHRLDLLENSIRTIDSGIILLEEAQEPVRLLGVPVDVVWDRGMIFPDLAQYLMQIVFLLRPKKIMECGSGVSTLILAKCLRQLGEGRLVSLEHDFVWATKVKEILDEEKLTSFAEVCEVPLRLQTFEGRSAIWYDAVEAIRNQGIFDLVFVDGPPAVKPDDPGRAGALYALFPVMKKGTLLLLDDGNRPGEQRVVEKWRKEFQNLIQVNYVQLKKGLWVIEKI